MSAIVTFTYVYFSYSGSHTRRPRAVNASTGFTSFNLNTGTSTLAPGTHFAISQVDLPPTLNIPGGGPCNFAFVNVTGLNEGGISSTDINNPPQGTAGSVPINVLVVYLPVGGVGGPGGSGAVIDAFDESTGTLVNDIFVTVSPDDAAGDATNYANIEGYVDTTGSAEGISAYNYITETMANFHRWVDLGNPAHAIPGALLNVNQGTTIYALAFYRNPAKAIHKEFIKEGKDIIKENVKEYIKEFVKETHKEFVKERNYEVVKDLGAEFGPGPWEGVVDPAILVSEMQKITQAVAQLETKVQNAVKGKAFIKEQDRPNVGKTVAKAAAAKTAPKKNR